MKQYTSEEINNFQTEVNNAIAGMQFIVPVFIPILIGVGVTVLDRESSRKFIPTAAAILDERGKFKIAINPEFVDELSLPELRFVLCHEAFHILGGHLTTPEYRRDKYDREIMNLSQDHVLNTNIKKIINTFNNSINKSKLSIPKDAVIYEELIEKNMTELEVYNWIVKNKQVEYTYNPEKSGPGKGEFSNVTKHVFDGSDGSEIEVVNSDLSGGKKANAETDLANIKIQVASEIEKSNKRGNVSNEVVEIFDKLTEIAIDPLLLFKNVINNYTTTKRTKRRTWTMVNKKTRHLPRSRLPGTRKIPIRNQSFNTAVVFRDCSGSTGSMQNEFNSVILNHLVPSFDNTIIIQHDVEIKKINEISRNSRNTSEIFEIHGMGGTSHKPSFDYMEEMKEIKLNQIDLVVILTDYFSDINEIWGDYKWHEGKPIKVIVPAEFSVDISTDVDENPIRYSIL